jgi:hypothetical protein
MEHSSGLVNGSGESYRAVAPKKLAAILPD